MKIIAIDFDGCLVESQWPLIGRPREEVFKAALAEKAQGSALILWTCRTGKYLDDAVEFCRAHGLEFDAVNDNLPETVAAYGGSNCRKIVADEYWDDCAKLIPDLLYNLLTLPQAAAMLADLFGDECACNVCGIDEWLPGQCVHTFDGTCPDPEGEHECWRQFLEYYQQRKKTPRALSDADCDRLIEIANDISRTRLFRYVDKHGQEIEAGMKIRIGNDPPALVYACCTQEMDEDLGINASNEDYLKHHPDAERVYYSLINFPSGIIEIVKEDT